MVRRNWTRDELLIVFNLYLRIPFGKMHSRNPDIVYLAGLIGRTPSSVAMRLSNFAHLDPYHISRGVIGMSGGAKQVQPIWEEYHKNKELLIFESEEVLSKFENKSIEIKYRNILTDINDFQGKERMSVVKTRINQNVFREIVLTNYNFHCAVTGINISQLLVASHIIPWSENENERLNPENGICLSSTWDKAFDKGLIGINPDYNLVFSEKLKEKSNHEYYVKLVAPYENRPIKTPEKYLPRKDFLEYHLVNIFVK